MIAMVSGFWMRVSRPSFIDDTLIGRTSRAVHALLFPPQALKRGTVSAWSVGRNTRDAWSPGRKKRFDFSFFAVFCGVVLALPPSTTWAEKAPPQPLPPCHQGFADVVEAVMPSVVNISISPASKRSSFQLTIPPGASPEDIFREMFDLPFSDHNTKKKKHPLAAATGFIIDGTGFIATNDHVVNDADELYVTLYDGTEYNAELYARASRYDIALLKIKPKKPLTPIKWGEASRVRVGDWSIVVGCPFGFNHTVTTGVISNIKRELETNLLPSCCIDSFFQTEASVNLGNSGGPLLNTKGEVIGMIMAYYSRSGGSIGLGFAIPSTTVQSVIEQLKTNRRVRQGSIGVRIKNIDYGVAKALNLKSDKGVMVAKVIEGGSAEKCGMKDGDIILKTNGVDIQNTHKLLKVMSTLKIGSKVPFVVWRHDPQAPPKASYVQKKLMIKIEEFKGDDVTQPGVNDHQNIVGQKLPLGLSISPLDKNQRKKLNIPASIKSGGVVQHVEKSTFASFHQIQQGDIILRVNETPISDQKSLNKAMASSPKSVLIMLYSPEMDAVRYISLTTKQR